MPVEVSHSPPTALHEPHHSNVRPKGILKNPSFSGSQDPTSPTQQAVGTPPSVPLDPADAKEITIQNTLQNAGPRRSSSAARRSSASRRHSSIANHDDDPERMRLKWDEANLYLAEQESGGRMKITEPKTPFEYGNSAMDVDDEEDISIDPRYVNVDEVDTKRRGKKARESDIPGLDIGEPEDETAGAATENDRIMRQSSLSRESSKEKHVSVDGYDVDHGDDEKHSEFEAQRRKHYEMKNVKDMLGHPEYDEDDEDAHMSRANGAA